MKKTISINLGSIAFTIDNDAYIALENYLEDIKSRLSPYENGEIIEDVESRIAEIFRKALFNNMQVVTLEIVLRTIAIIGPASSFGGRQTTYNYKGKLSRSSRNSILGGVCSGIGEFFGIDPMVVRLVTLLLMVGVLSIFVYIILWIVLPKSNIY